jgi:hypothetical protein
MGVEQLGELLNKFWKFIIESLPHHSCQKRHPFEQALNIRVTGRINP